MLRRDGKKTHTIKAAIKQASKQTNKQKVFQDAQRLETTAEETDAVLEEWRQRSPKSACCRHFDNPKVQNKNKIKSLLYDLLTKRSGVLTIRELQHRGEEIGKEASNQTSSSPPLQSEEGDFGARDAHRKIDERKWRRRQPRVEEEEERRGSCKVVASGVSTMKTKAHDAGNLGNPTDEGSIPGSNLLQATPLHFYSTPKCLRILTLTLRLPS
jgi:hypothetical protein